jgi:hypothetical protein
MCYTEDPETYVGVRMSELSWQCPECKGFSDDSECCPNPDCPNQPCCGQSLEGCSCAAVEHLFDDGDPDD